MIDTRWEHQLPINDINHVWSVEIDGVETYFGKCTCGKVFSGTHTSDVTMSYIAHVDEAALGNWNRSKEA